MSLRTSVAAWEDTFREFLQQPIYYFAYWSYTVSQNHKSALALGGFATEWYIMIGRAHRYRNRGLVQRHSQLNSRVLLVEWWLHSIIRFFKTFCSGILISCRPTGLGDTFKIVTFLFFIVEMEVDGGAFCGDDVVCYIVITSGLHTINEATSQSKSNQKGDTFRTICISISGLVMFYHTMY
jgi:hypothetical protein